MSLLRNNSGKFGCGTGIFFLKKEKTFFSACKLHDVQYDKQGPKLTRRQSDSFFLKNMLKLAKGKPVHLLRAFLYFLLVRLFGWIFFKKKAFYTPEQIQSAKDDLKNSF